LSLKAVNIGQSTLMLLKVGVQSESHQNEYNNISFLYFSIAILESKLMVLNSSSQLNVSSRSFIDRATSKFNLPFLGFVSEFSNLKYDN